MSGTPPTYTGFATYKVSGAVTFNLATLTGGTAYTLNVNAEQ